jgi:hypothetical protein
LLNFLGKPGRKPQLFKLIAADTYIPRPGTLKILLEAGHRDPAGFGQKGQLYSTGEYGNVHDMENMISYSYGCPYQRDRK